MNVPPALIDAMSAWAPAPTVTVITGTCGLPDSFDAAMATIKFWFIAFLIVGGGVAALACLAGMLLGHLAHLRRISEASQEGLVWVIGIEIAAGMIVGLVSAVTTIKC